MIQLFGIIVLFLGMCGDGTLGHDMQEFYYMIIPYIWNIYFGGFLLFVIICVICDSTNKLIYRKKYTKL